MVNTSRYWLRSSTLLCAVVCLGLLAAAIREFRTTVLAQEWEPSIRAFERQDKIHPVPPGAIVFTGSSSIAYWSSLVDDMKPLTVINRGFGGSEYTDVDHYADRIVIAYRPAAVVVYAGDNDLASPGRKTAQSVAQDAQQFVQIVHAKLPQTWVFVLSIKPSILRWKAWPEMMQANQLIAGFLRTQDHAAYIDVASPMLDSRGGLSSELFVADGLHPSAKCYALWTSLIKPVLLQHFSPTKTSSRFSLPLEASKTLFAGGYLRICCHLNSRPL
jgi:lysophospholipase L1-like esterase